MRRSRILERDRVWISPIGAPVDLMVPDPVAGTGRRGARVPPHSAASMRRARGIEGALIDNSKAMIGALDPAADSRRFEVSVAGRDALLVAKLHEIDDRLDASSRRDNKDAHDICRLLLAIDTPVRATALRHLLEDELSADVTAGALDHLRTLFADGPTARGSVMAGAAEELVGDPAAVSEAVAPLAQDLLEDIGG